MTMPTPPVSLPVEEAIPDRPEMTFHDDSRIAMIATFPKRYEVFRWCLRSIINQVDHVFVYLNGYTEPPDYLVDNPKITYFLGSSFRDLRANGKVFYLDSVKNGYVFSLDDDNIYPWDYCEKVIQKIDFYKRKCVITVHGSILPPFPHWYYERTAMFPYQLALETDRVCNLAGSATLSFHRSTINAAFADFLPDVMVDLQYSILCKEQGIPIVSMSRPARWIQNLDNDGLYQEFVASLTHHTSGARRHAPWDFETIASYALPIFEDVFEGASHRQVARKYGDAMFIEAARARRVPPLWRKTPLLRRKQKEYQENFL